MKENFFKWFNLPEAYQIDLDLLQKNYYSRSKLTHPDNFHDKSDFEKKMAEQALRYTHEAFNTLSCPIKRASYILWLNNIDLNSEAIQEKAMPADFLEKIFEWQSQGSRKNLEQYLQNNLSRVAKLLSQKEFELAILPVREILFIQKFLEHV